MVDNTTAKRPARPQVLTRIAANAVVGLALSTTGACAMQHQPPDASFVKPGGLGDSTLLTVVAAGPGVGPGAHQLVAATARPGERLQVVIPSAHWVRSSTVPAPLPMKLPTPRAKVSETNRAALMGWARTSSQTCWRTGALTQPRPPLDTGGDTAFAKQGQENAADDFADDLRSACRAERSVSVSRETAWAESAAPATITAPRAPLPMALEAARSAIVAIGQTQTYASRVIVILGATAAPLNPLQPAAFAGDVVMVVTPRQTSSAVATATQARLLEAGARYAVVLGPAADSTAVASYAGAALDGSVKRAVVKHLLFANDSAQLSAKDRLTLRTLLPLVTRRDVVLVLDGFASTTGSRETNAHVAAARCATATRWLLSHRVSANNVLVISHGENDLPVTPGISAANRRLTIVVAFQPPNLD